MKHKLADRIDKIQPSFTLQMATIAAELRAKGESVINFSVGEPDFNTPGNIIDAGKKAMDQGYTKYTAGPGMIEFRQAICKKLKLENGLEYSIDEILSAINDLQNLKNDKTNKILNTPRSKLENSNIPKNTLKLIEEAEKSKN